MRLSAAFLLYFALELVTGLEPRMVEDISKLRPSREKSMREMAWRSKENHRTEKESTHTGRTKIASTARARKAAQKEFLNSLREQTSVEQMSSVINPWSQDNAGAEVKEGNLGEIPVITITALDGRAITAPGHLRIQEANASLVHLRGKARKYFIAQEAMRNQWSKTKAGALLKWLKRTSAQDPEKLVIVTDGGDVVFGGCTEKEIRSYYDAIVIASAQGGTNPKVVAAAEVSPYPSGMMPYYNQTFRTDLVERMHNISKALDVKDNWVMDFADCRDPLGGPCDFPPSYRFLNYGFLMGPAKRLEEMVAHVHKEGGWDQVAAHSYFLLHPEAVTLDYTGSLSLSLHNLAEDGDSPLSVKRNILGKKHIFNKVTGTTQCFIHGNGNSENFVRRLAVEMGE